MAVIGAHGQIRDRHWLVYIFIIDYIEFICFHIISQDIHSSMLNSLNLNVGYKWIPTPAVQRVYLLIKTQVMSVYLPSFYGIPYFQIPDSAAGDNMEASILYGTSVDDTLITRIWLMLIRYRTVCNCSQFRKPNDTWQTSKWDNQW